MYVDDLIITSNDDLVVTHIITRLDSNFSTKDLGVLSFFCGVEVIRDTNGLFLTEQKYIVNLLTKHNMLDSKPVSTPLAMGTSLTIHYGASLVYAPMYHRVVGCLQHLQMTRPDISFVVNKLSQFMHSPFENH